MQPDEDLNRSKPDVVISVVMFTNINLNLFIYYSYCVLMFYFSILDLIFICEFLVGLFSTKSGFVSMIVSCLYLDYPLLDYFILLSL